MFGSHKLLLVRHTGPLLVFGVIWEVVYLEAFPWFCLFVCLLLFSKTAPRFSDPGIDFFFCSIFEVCGLSKVFEFCQFFKFLPDQLVYLCCLHSLSCILSFPCVFLGQLSDFLSSDFLNVFPFVYCC